MKLGFVLLIFFYCINLKAQDFKCFDTWYTGEGTQYGGIAGGAGGHCGIYVDSGDIYHAAMNHEQYAESQACGACIRILGPKGETTLKIVDECPECKFGDIDMTTAVFPQLADMKDGRIKIRWQYVPCPQYKQMTAIFAPGSGSYYFKMQIGNFYYPITKLEYKKSDNSYDTINRSDYNYFVKQGGIDVDKQKTGPYNFRITAITGQIIEIANVEFNTSDIIPLGVQFADLHCPDCAGVAGGSAQRDNCDVCSGGTTGITPNSTCQKDCAGYWEGTAYTDTCGKCVAGTTGATPCNADCFGTLGGMAFIDNCKNCVGGKTNLAACMKDCNNVWGGNAMIDSCGKCAGGNTGRSPILSKNTCDATLLNELYFNNKITYFYPNPFEEILYSNYPEEIQHLQIFDQKGILILDEKSELEKISTKTLPSGLYMLRVQTKTEVQTSKFIKN